MDYRSIIVRQAYDEIEEENKREQIDAIKEKIRSKTPWWHRAFPFTIEIKRREK